MRAFIKNGERLGVRDVFLHIQPHVNGSVLTRNHACGEQGFVCRADFIAKSGSHVVLNDAHFRWRNANSARSSSDACRHRCSFCLEADSPLFVIIAVSAVRFKREVWLASYRRYPQRYRGCIDGTFGVASLFWKGRLLKALTMPSIPGISS